MGEVTLHCGLGLCEIRVGDVRARLAEIPDGSIQTIVTSPPFWGLRDYGVEGQIGLEETPEAYVAQMVALGVELRRVLRDDGTLWLNLGDSHNGQGARSPNIQDNGDLSYRAGGRAINVSALKPKDLCGIPWRVALALQADGWYLRSDIIWSKPNPMPESVTDRPTKAHEYVFLLSKSARYYYDAEALRVSADPRPSPPRESKTKQAHGTSWHNNAYAPGPSGYGHNPAGRNARSVWHIATQAYPEAHFATFPAELPTRCIKAGSRPGDTVLDPFAGSGTTLSVAAQLGRRAIGIELNEEYAEMARRRIERETRPNTARSNLTGDAPLFAGMG